MNIDTILKLQGGYRNTTIPYDMEAIKRQIADQSNIYIPTKQVKQEKVYYKDNIEPKFNNIVYNSQLDTALAYIKELRKLEEQGNMQQYNNKIQYLYDIMNYSNGSVVWVSIVYNYLHK